MACIMDKNQDIKLPECYIWLSQNQLIDLIHKQILGYSNGIARPENQTLFYMGIIWKLYDEDITILPSLIRDTSTNETLYKIEGEYLLSDSFLITIGSSLIYGKKNLQKCGIGKV